MIISDLKEIEIFKPISQGMTFIGCDIHENVRTYHFRDFEAIKSFMKKNRKLFDYRNSVVYFNNTRF